MPVTPSIATWALAASLQAAPTAPAADAAPVAGTYVVTVDRSLRSVAVRAELTVLDGRLFMDSIQAQQLERGWATHVRDLVATDEGGRTIALEPRDTSAWVLDPGAKKVRLSYTLDLAFARASWPAGNEQAGYVADDALYLVTKSLFITTSAPGSFRVTFDLPARWRASSPWAPVGADERTFSVADATELLRNAVVLGEHAEIRQRSGAFTLLLALPGPIAAGREQITPVVQASVARFLRVFPRTPPTRFLMTVFHGPDDGEAFRQSATFTTADSIRPEGALVWANFIAHELFHHWNGQRIRGAGPNSAWQWFSEGVTEYVANLALVRDGIVDEARFLKKVERHLGNYVFFEISPLFPDSLTLRSAGAQKTRYRFAVYDGGWTAALCIDGLIREESGGAHRLEDLLRLLHEEHALTGKPWDAATLEVLARRLGAPSVGPFVENHTLRRNPMPVAACLSRMGYRAVTKPYGAEVYVAPLADPRGAAARREWLAP